MGYNQAWRPAFDTSSLVVEVWPLFGYNIADEEGHSLGSIDSSYYWYKTVASQPILQLPEGWATAYDTNHYHDREGFAHVSIPDQTFNFPFPVFPQLPAMGILSFFLKFSSQSCTMSLGAGFRDISDLFTVQGTSPTCLLVDVMENTGLWAGVIESLFVEEDEYTHGQDCELVAISGGCALRTDDDFWIGFQAFDEMSRKTELSEIDKYEFYNVLWIEREQGVAYRKAIGRIWAPVWKRQDLKDVEILLG